MKQQTLQSKMLAFLAIILCFSSIGIALSLVHKKSQQSSSKSDLLKSRKASAPETPFEEEMFKMITDRFQLKRNELLKIDPAPRLCFAKVLDTSRGLLQVKGICLLLRFKPHKSTTYQYTMGLQVKDGNAVIKGLTTVEL